MLIDLRDADVSADGVLADLVDDNFFGNVRAGGIEENGFIGSAVLLLEALVFDDHGQVKLVPLLVYTLEFDGHVGNLLRAVPAGNGELGVVALTQTAKLVNFVVVASDEGSHFALGHLQVFAGGIEIGSNAHNLGIHRFDIIAGRFGGQFGMYGSIECRYFLVSFVNQLRGFHTGFLELALGDLQLVRDDFQIALEIRIRLLILRQTVFQR